MTAVEGQDAADLATDARAIQTYLETATHLVAEGVAATFGDCAAIPFAVRPREHRGDVAAAAEGEARRRGLRGGGLRVRGVGEGAGGAMPPPSSAALGATTAALSW